MRAQPVQVHSRACQASGDRLGALWAGLALPRFCPAAAIPAQPLEEARAASRTPERPVLELPVAVEMVPQLRGRQRLRRTRPWVQGLRA